MTDVPSILDVVKASDVFAGLNIPAIRIRESVQQLIDIHRYDTPLSCDECASSYPDVVEGLLDIYRDPGRKPPIDTTPYLINGRDIWTYARPVSGPYYCMICQMDHTNEIPGVSLTCGGMKCKFCLPTITKWLTECASTCPYCRVELNA